ncbi:MAG: hypothetical protein LBI42_01175, partial [Chitinispirillales bacterium]|nr:hypothetical protein [Chitinispirillales bacterium]
MDEASYEKKRELFFRSYDDKKVNFFSVLSNNIIPTMEVHELDEMIVLFYENNDLNFFALSKDYISEE